MDATNIEVKLLDNPDLEAIDWWEVHYTTAHPKETVDTIRHLFIDTVNGAVDDANEGFGFTIGQDRVDVHEVYTTDEATTKIVVRARRLVGGSAGKPQPTNAWLIGAGCGNQTACYAPFGASGASSTG